MVLLIMVHFLTLSQNVPSRFDYLLESSSLFVFSFYSVEREIVFFRLSTLCYLSFIFITRVICYVDCVTNPERQYCVYGVSQ